MTKHATPQGKSVDRRSFLRATGVAAASLPLAGFAGLESSLAPKPDLWERWTWSDQGGNDAIDHSAWTEFLKTHVVEGSDGINRIAYGPLPTIAIENLDRYLASLTRRRITTFNRAQQEAYWINLYNALTVKVVLTHYPVASIRDIDLSTGFFSAFTGGGPWDRALVQVEGVGVSLNDIEHRILRPIWRDRRIHYALNCASIGCPSLQTQAFTAENMSVLLDKAAHTYINSPRGMRLEGDKLIVSKIYSWYQDDFGGSQKGVLRHLHKYADGALKEIVADRAGIDGYEYDWALNDATPK